MKEKHVIRTQEKGITLIALVVTIVVLLILAGVSITVLFSDSGIITMAQKAAKETQKSCKKAGKEGSTPSTEENRKMYQSVSNNGGFYIARFEAGI